MANSNTTRDGLRTYQGAVAVITGGASGIGRALGLALASKGAAEIVIADLNAEPSEEVAALVRKAGSRATVVPLDVRDDTAVRKMFDEIEKTSKRIDYVFNNAGIGVMGEAQLQDERDWGMQIEINVGGLANVIRAAYPRLIAQKFGHLVNTASLAGLIGTPFLSAYCGTKHFVVGVSKSMRVEAARHGVRVSVLCPGVVKTPLLTSGKSTLGRCVYPMSDERLMRWWSMFKPGSVEVFAEEALAALAKNESVIVLPKHNRLPLRLARLVPGLEEKFATKLYEASLRHYPEIANATKS